MSKKYYILGGLILFLLIVMIALLALSPSGNKTPQGNIELTWWKTFETSDNVQDLISDYQQAHPNVTINFVKKDVSTYQQDLLQAYANGTGPDILSIHNDWLPQELDKVAPMPAGLMSLRQYQDTFVDVATNDFIKDGQIYAAPMNVDVLAMYYNRDILGSSGIVNPPQTWDELARDDVPRITTLTKPGTFLRSAVALGTASNVNRAVDILSLLMLQNGTQFYNEDYSFATFDQQGFSDPSTQCSSLGCLALEYYAQFSNAAKKTYTWNSKSDNSVDAFTQGKLGIMFSYYYMQPQIKDKGPTLNWGVAPMPQPSLNSVKVNFANYWGEAVNKNSPNVAAAWDFINFITGKEELSKYYSAHKLVASRKDILSTQLGDPELGVFAEGALTAKSVYKKNADNFEGTFSQMIDDVSVRGLTPSEALSNAVQRINLDLQN